MKLPPHLVGFDQLTIEEKKERVSSWTGEELKSYVFAVFREALLWNLADSRHFWNKDFHDERLMRRALSTFTDEELLAFAQMHRELRDSR